MASTAPGRGERRDDDPLPLTVNGRCTSARAGALSLT